MVRAGIPGALKNEIASHAVAAMHYILEVRTVIEIGGQDSKIILTMKSWTLRPLKRSSCRLRL